MKPVNDNTWKPRQLTENRTSVGPSQAPPPKAQEWTLENFLQHHSATFDGKTSSDEANQWMKNMERIFKVVPSRID